MRISAQSAPLCAAGLRSLPSQYLCAAKESDARRGSGRREVGRYVEKNYFSEP